MSLQELATSITAHHILAKWNFILSLDNPIEKVTMDSSDSGGEDDSNNHLVKGNGGEDGHSIDLAILVPGKNSMIQCQKRPILLPRKGQKKTPNKRQKKK